MGKKGSIKRVQYAENSITGEPLLSGSVEVIIRSDSHCFQIGDDTFFGSVEAALNPDMKDIIKWLKDVTIIEKPVSPFGVIQPNIGGPL